MREHDDTPTLPMLLGTALILALFIAAAVGVPG